MLFSSIISTSLLAIGAMALPAALKARDTCQHIYAPSLNYLSSKAPNVGSQTVTTPFYVWSQGGKTDLLASFKNIPANSYGCTLQFDYKLGRNPTIQSVSGDPLRIDVYRVDISGNFPTTPTWNNINSRTGSLVGTWHFPSGADLNQAKTININSFVCSPTMDFRFTVSDPNGVGGVSITEGPVAGLRMAYNC
jgi:hypothetical protein